MSTDLVLYQRWAVDDPVLDCAIMIVDMALYREALEAEDPEDYDEPCDWDLSDLVIDRDVDRPIDQIHCNDCGRPMIVWSDEPLVSTLCGRCRSGLTPEWEY